jgi:hypothetical protein
MVAAKVVPVRLPEEVLARVEAQRARLGQSTGLTLSQSQVLRMIIERGLAALEAEASHPPRKR